MYSWPVAAAPRGFMFSIIGGRIRCEMGKSGHECYTEQLQPRVRQSTSEYLRVPQSTPEHPRVRQSCLFSPGRVGVGSPRCDGRQQMGEIGNQEQTIGDSRDDCRRTIRKPFTLKKPTSGDISEWCECVRVKPGVPRVQSRSH